MAYYIEEIKQYWVYDPEGAERLLDEAGYPRGADGVRFRTEILARVPVTLELGAAALLIGLVIALPVGIYSAVRQGTLGDYVGRSVAIFGLDAADQTVCLQCVVQRAPSLRRRDRW